MTTEQVLKVLRRHLNEVDPVVSELTDEELLEALSDARDILELRKVTGVDELAVGSELGDPDYGILPEPTIEQGHMLALQAAANLLEQKYRSRLFQGELGVSWQSGLESESTISAEKAYRDALQSLRDQLTELILIKRAPTSATRPQ